MKSALLFVNVYDLTETRWGAAPLGDDVVVRQLSGTFNAGLTRPAVP
jgi:hypothetical protein